MALCGVMGVFSAALWFDFRRFYTIDYSCIGLCRSGRSVAFLGLSMMRLCGSAVAVVLSVAFKDVLSRSAMFGGLVYL